MIHPSEGVADTSKFEKALPPYPLFLKLATEGSSKGIEKDNKVNGLAELKPVIQKLRHQFPDQDILVESFLSGREFTVSIMGTGAQSRVIGIREHIWQENSIDGTDNDYHSDPTPNFACRLNKSNRSNKMLIYNDSHDMDEPQVKATCQVALDAWKVLNCRDCGRVDIRFDSDKPGSSPNVLEVGIRSYLYHIKRRKLIFVFIGQSYCWASPRAFAATSFGEKQGNVFRKTHLRNYRNICAKNTSSRCATMFELNSKQILQCYR